MDLSNNEITFREYLMMLGIPDHWFHKYMTNYATIGLVKKGDHFSTCVWGFEADVLSKSLKNKLFSSNKLRFIPLEKIFPEKSKNLYRLEKTIDSGTIRTELPLTQAIQNFKKGMKKIHKDAHDMISNDVYNGEDYYECYHGEVLINKFAEDEYKSYGFHYGNYKEQDFDHKKKGKIHLLPPYLDCEQFFLYEVNRNLYLMNAFDLKYVHSVCLELHDKIIRIQND